MVDRAPDDSFSLQSKRRFEQLVRSTGVKRFAQSLGVSTRQVNRMLSGAQPNPVERIVRCMESADPEVGDDVLEFICQEMGGHFVRDDDRHGAPNEQALDTVSECAKRIASLEHKALDSTGLQQVRDAIRTLSSAVESLRGDGGSGKAAD